MGTTPAAGLEIRLASLADAAQIAAIYAPIVRDTTISFELEPPDAVEIGRRMATVLTTGRPWLVCTSGTEIIGYSYAGRYRERPAYKWSVESSICVASSARSRGVGRALYESLLAALALQGFRRVYAAIATPNDVSVALHRAVGFECIGTFHDAGFKDGKWRDVEWWECLLVNPPGSPRAPEDPLTLEQLVHTARWHDALSHALRVVRAK